MIRYAPYQGYDEPLPPQQAAGGDAAPSGWESEAEYRPRKRRRSRTSQSISGGMNVVMPTIVRNVVTVRSRKPRPARAETFDLFAVSPPPPPPPAAPDGWQDASLFTPRRRRRTYSTGRIIAGSQLIQTPEGWQVADVRASRRRSPTLAAATELFAPPVAVAFTVNWGWQADPVPVRKRRMAVTPPGLFFPVSPPPATPPSGWNIEPSGAVSSARRQRGRAVFRVTTVETVSLIVAPGAPVSSYARIYMLMSH